MSTLKLITTEKFGDLDCNFYRNMNDDILLTREQIGTALEYRSPDASLSMIHKRHINRLDNLSVVTKLLSTDGKEYKTTLYSQRGVMEICRWSNKPKANDFMDWVWTIIEKYRSGELNNNQFNLQPLVDVITTLSSSIVAMQQDIISIKQSQDTIQKQIPKKRFSFWATKMFPKYQMLMDYFNIQENKNPYKELHKGFRNTYPDIEINQIIDDYCYENKLDSCYTLDAIEHDKNTRILFESTVDGLLEKYELVSNDDPVRQKTIFDIKVENISLDHQKGPVINE